MTTPGTAKGSGGSMGFTPRPKNPKNSKITPGAKGSPSKQPVGKYKLPK